VSVDYDLNAVFDELAAVFDGISTGMQVSGEPVTLTAYAEVPGQVSVPALVLELDELTWDVTMGRGSDSWTIVGTALVQFADQQDAQRALRAFLSADGGLGRLKAALQAEQSLSGLVSYAQLAAARRIGKITYNGVDYLGCELVIEVMS
jgi:hypothetical protein